MPRFDGRLLVLALLASRCAPSVTRAPDVVEDSTALGDATRSDGAHSDGPRQDPPTRDLRISGRALIAWVRVDAESSWWIEEELAAIPYRAGDREIGRRSLVRRRGDAEPELVYRPSGDERLAWAVAHPSGQWTAAVTTPRGAITLVRGAEDGSLLGTIAADDPLFASDPLASIDAPGGPERSAPIAPGRAEDSVRLAPHGESVLLTLTTYWGSALAYRWSFVNGAFVRGTRTLLVPAAPLPVFIPDTASYDVFDAITNPWSTHACVAPDGSAYVALWVDQVRVTTINNAWRAGLALLRRDLSIAERPSDILVTQIQPDGARAMQLIVGTPDVDDDPFAIACARDGRVAVAGRHRREPGRDNTEIHGFAAVINAQQRSFEALSFDGERLALIQSVDFAPDGSMLLAGSEGWEQNPVGVSVGGEGRPFVLQWSGRATNVQRWSSPNTRGHAEVRALRVESSHVWLGGIENGPVTHSFDGDRSALRGDGWIQTRAIDASSGDER